jgi:hypothetical protein
VAVVVLVYCTTVCAWAGAKWKDAIPNHRNASQKASAGAALAAITCIEVVNLAIKFIIAIKAK